jgi:hypothetical protein
MADTLERATRAFRRAEQVASERRKELHNAIVEAVAGGMSKSEAARRTGYTREYVAKIVG